VLDKHFNRATSEYEGKPLEEPHHSENCDVSSQTDDVMPDSQRELLVQVWEAILKVLSLTKEVRQLVHLMSLTRTKIQNLPESLDGQTTLPLGQVSRIGMLRAI